MGNAFKDQVLLITGGTGSFGQTMTQHALDRDVAEIRILSRDEAKQDAMRQELDDPRVRFILGDTRDLSSVLRATKGATLAFHAAALKQVPSAEFFPMESVKTNILGSHNVITACIQNEVSSVVCLSTDKAVYPINAMGMSKALMEKTCQALAREYGESATKISITRYGNVMYSRGSVLPLFVRQIRSGGPITVTNPQMTRFMMSLEESVDLVAHAFQSGTTGDLFVRKAPAASVGQLAEALIRIFSRANQIDINTIGVRHGEKLYESLLSSEEAAHAVDEGEYFRVPLDVRDLNYAAFFEEGEVLPENLNSYNSHNTVQLDDVALERLIRSLPQIQKEINS